MIFVIGDRIKDFYRFGQATRLCPEAPVPVIVPESEDEREGGAALVYMQLVELLGGENVRGFFGSESRKERIFANNCLIARWDEDSKWCDDNHEFERRIVSAMRTEKPQLIIISDYGKCALTEAMANRLMRAANTLEIPVLVDAKNRWHFYPGAFAYFPNAVEEFAPDFNPKKSHVIRKLGPKGCEVDGELVEGSPNELRDGTGAGDVFLAAFAAKLATVISSAKLHPISQIELEIMAEFANQIAGKSVEHIGTYVVKGRL